MTAIMYETFDELLKELSAKKEEISFVVAYSKESAEPLLIAPGGEPSAVVSGEGPIDAKIVRESLADKEYVEMKSTTIFHAYKNPRCQILTASGQWVRVC